MKPSKSQLAEESLKTKKTRAKLKKRLEAMDQRFDDQLLQRKTAEIHRWIARHAQDRVVLKSKDISLFDENQNAADVSKRIHKVMERLTQSQEKA